MSETGTFAGFRCIIRVPGPALGWERVPWNRRRCLRKCKYAFLTLPNYSLIAVANAIEPLRMANRLVGKDVYDWSVISLDGAPSESSTGLKLSPTGALDKLGPLDILFVCGGVNIREAVSPALLIALAPSRGAPRRPGGAVHRGLCARARGTSR